MGEEEYREFSSKLIPTVDKSTVIGVRIPLLRKYAKSLEDYEDFLDDLPHKYFEENNLHAFLIERERDFDACIEKLDVFLPYVDNWAVTDVIRPKLFKKYPDLVLDKIKVWLDSEYEYVVRFGVVSLLQFYLDDNFNTQILDIIKNINSNYFYVNMAIAWFYSFALIKQYDSTIKYFEDRRLDKWIHNKSIQKAIESYRISEERKTYLRSLKIK